jgi:hypothetical protein
VTSASPSGDARSARLHSMLESSDELTGLAAQPPDHPEPVLVVCSYCDRIRAPFRDWRRAGAEERQRLLRRSALLVSHGCCPECFDRELAKCHVRVAPPEWRARRW